MNNHSPYGNNEAKDQLARQRRAIVIMSKLNQEIYKPLEDILTNIVTTRESMRFLDQIYRDEIDFSLPEGSTCKNEVDYKREITKGMEKQINRDLIRIHRQTLRMFNEYKEQGLKSLPAKACPPEAG